MFTRSVIDVASGEFLVCLTNVFLYFVACCHLFFTQITESKCGPGSSVGIATDNGLDRPGSNPGWDEFSAHPDRP
jgi:hypothetical protein